MNDARAVVEVDAIDCRYEPRPWAFTHEHAAEIDRRWTAACAEKPSLFNGRVLLMHRGDLVREPDGRLSFHAAYLETEFKAFLAWRDMGMPDAGIRNGFGMAGLIGSDEAYVLGEMAAHTANAGAVYFASGTPDPSDVADGSVDIEGSVGRELLEETGIAPQDVIPEPGMTLVIDRHRIGFMKILRSPLTADVLKARIEAFLARETQPELSRIHIVRTPDDIGPNVQVSCAAFLRAKLKR